MSKSKPATPPTSTVNCWGCVILLILLDITHSIAITFIKEILCYVSVIKVLNLGCHGTTYTIPAPVAQYAECPRRGTGGHGRDIPKSLKMVLAAPRLAVELGLVDPVSG